MTKIIDAITSLMTAAIVGTPSGAIYSTQDHVTPSYVRKSDGYLAALGVDISCVSPYNSKTLHNCGVTAVSSRIGMTVDHYLGSASRDLWLNESVRFVTMGGTLVTKVITGVEVVGSTDILLLRFNTSVTASGINVAKVLQVGWQAYMPTIRNDGGIPRQIVPAMFSNQNEAMGISMWWGENEQSAGLWVTDGMDPGDADAYIPNPLGTNLDFVPYYAAPTVGASGNNGLSLVEPGTLRMILLNPIGGGAAEGPSVARHRDEINAAMDSLVSGQSLTEADFSAYEQAKLPLGELCGAGGLA